jgi:hypothetical protein
MLLDLRPFLGIEVLLALVVIAMIAWRKAVARGEDDTLHVLQGDALPQQSAVAQKLDMIDKWGKTLTVIAVVFGLLLAGLYVYQVWVQGTTQVPMRG